MVITTHHRWMTVSFHQKGIIGFVDDFILSNINKYFYLITIVLSFIFCACSEISRLDLISWKAKLEYSLLPEVDERVFENFYSLVSFIFKDYFYFFTLASLFVASLKA